MRFRQNTFQQRDDVLLSLTAVLLAMPVAWWVIVTVATRPPLRLCTIVLTTFATGIALSLLRHLLVFASGGWTVAASQIAGLGDTLAGLAILATAIIFVWTILAALIDRL